MSTLLCIAAIVMGLAFVAMVVAAFVRAAQITELERIAGREDE